MPKPLRSITVLPAMNKETGEITVIVETPKGSRSKYAHDPVSGAYELKFVLPVAMTFPVDFGFIRSTPGQDGDPLDVVLLLDESLVVGTKVSCRLVGALKANEREQGGGWECNDQLLAVASRADTFERWKSLADLPIGFLREIEVFFERYNQLHGKAFKVEDRLDRETAKKLVKKGLKLYRKVSAHA